jgi:DNA-binding transcriptional ArsR family regulator
VKPAEILWRTRRTLLLQRACKDVAERLKTGAPVCLTIRRVAARFRGRCLGSPRHRLRLSARTLQGHWYASERSGPAVLIDRALIHFAAQRSDRQLAILAVFLRAARLGGAAKMEVQARRALWLRQRCDDLLAMKTFRKPRKIMGKIRLLPEDQRAEIDRWLFEENLTYREIARRIRELFNVSISGGTLSAYYTRRTNISKPKPRRSKLASLPVDQREAVHQWFRENLSYREIAKCAAERFGLTISPSALCSYYEIHHWEIFGPVAEMEAQA